MNLLHTKFPLFLRKALKYPLCRIFWIIIPVIFVVAEGWGFEPYEPVQPDPVLESWRWRSFPELKGKGLFCLTEAADGAMWFGLDSGVERYDGIHWTPYTANDGIYGPPVRALHATSDGSVYAGTERGLSCFRDGVWKRIFPSRDVHPWPIYNLTEAADGSLWVATGWGALHISAADTILYTSEDVASAVQVIEPGLTLSMIPAPVRPWPQGTGIAVTMGHHRLDQGNVYWVVSGLAPGGPGETGGVKLGDHIVAVDGQPIPIERDGPAGTTVRLSVLRNSSSDSIHFTLMRQVLQGGFRSYVSDLGQ